MENYIIDKMEWTCLKDIPSNGTALSEAFWGDSPSTSGVYLVAKKEDLEEIGDDIIHEKIGYTGMTTNAPYRVYSLRTNSHNCGTYIKSQGWNIEDVYVRFLYTDEDNCGALERELHNEAKKTLGGRFGWTKASAGNDGKLTQIETSIEKCTLDEITEVYQMVDQRIKQLLLEKHLQDLL